MLTTQSIFEELQSETKSFPTYKDLLNNVGKIWQRHLGVLPVEIGPKDLVELAVLRQWIQQDENGAIRIVIPKEIERPAPSGSKRSPASRDLASESSRTRTGRATPGAAARSSIGQWVARPLISQIAKSRTASGQ